MRIIFIVFLTIMLAASSGCKKNEAEKLKLEGTITDSSTGAALSGVTIQLEAQLLQSGTFNNNFQNLTSATTNSAGAFEIKVERDNFNDMRITYSKDSYLDLVEIVNPDVLTPEGTDFSTTLDPISFINVRLINASPSNESDVIEFRYTSAYFPQCACCNNSVKTFTGTSIDTTISCTVVGNSQLDYAYFVTKNGFETVTTDGVFVNSFETEDVTINY